MKQTFRYRVSTSLEQAVETYKKTDFFIASMKKAGARSVEIVEEVALPDGGRRWKAKITDASRLPEFLRTSDILIMVNETAFYPNRRQLEFNIAPAAKTLRVALLGTIDIREKGTETELLYTVELTIGIPFFGRRTEALGLKVVGDECRKQAALLGGWATKPDSD